jgi:tryptophan-rich sensory protein
MILNLSWTTIFFRYQQILLGLITIILMISLAIITMIEFYPINQIAAYLFVPYIAWLGVAFSLNLYIYLYN